MWLDVLLRDGLGARQGASSPVENMQGSKTWKEHGSGSPACFLISHSKVRV